MIKPGAQWLARVFGPGRAAKVASCYRAALDPSTQAGRLVLADLACYCRMGKSSFVPGDPHQTAFNEGARDVFLHVIEIIGLTPEEFPNLLKEIDGE